MASRSGARSRENSLEPFPPVVPRLASTLSTTRPRARRKSSGLGGEPRGDTGAGSFATMANEFKSAAAYELGNASPSSRPRGSKRRKAKTLFRRWKSISLKHTWLNPLVLVLIILGLYAINPSPDNPLHSAIFLSYPISRQPHDDPSTPIQYGKGGKDFAFVAFYIVVLSFTREFLMQRLIRPIAIKAGIKSRAKQSRFMEQYYTAIYFAIFGPFGLYVMYRSPLWYFKTIPMFEGFPHKTHEGLFKAYYLLQASYWAQQAIVLVLLLEKPRKDFKELVAHHIITVALIWCSYRFHFTYMGLGVYITHDISDFFLATSKILNYLDSPICGPYFAFFIGVWAYCRHYLNLRIIWATLTEFRTVGPFELNWVTQQYKCWISQYITFGLLASLQSVNLFWFFLICRIAKNYVLNKVGKDERSDDGDDDEDEDELEGSTEEKRERMAKLMANGTGHANGGPKVLLNGSPVDDGTQARVTGAKLTYADADVTSRKSGR